MKGYFDARGLAHPARRSTRSPRGTSATPAQVALAWLIAQPRVTAPIASATSLAQLNEIMQRRGSS